MEFKVVNGSREVDGPSRADVRDARGPEGIRGLTNDNKVFAALAACGTRPASAGSSPVGTLCRAWGNPVPVPARRPGGRGLPRGGSRAFAAGFVYEGTDIDAELKRLKEIAFK